MSIAVAHTLHHNKLVMSSDVERLSCTSKILLLYMHFHKPQFTR